MTPWDHAISSAVHFGGDASDYILVHDWLDSTKQYTGNWTHRMFRHHSAGVQWAIELFGHTVQNSVGEHVPTKKIAEQHILEDCGFIPTPADWAKCVGNNPEDWMLRVKKKNVQNMELA